ncbi:molybdate ABC transporter substrate-binding protein [Marinomonas ostreistagni]|uniref:molybdate ABC transporter substrate-binding protein n=1 Tax=Marinomonas ostreistagni TaxID=359209 RepID=UPI001950FC50|nr:molybdate ABC transporter substrate-binding protein [Marinomonas ostreistagni]MBM6551874.1 molybdate ABC transporter substrate-binding protein [Marinomonas ostreistagni]
MTMLNKLPLLVLGCAATMNASAAQVHAAVAANFTEAMKSVVEKFEAETGHEVVLSFGSSGKILAQIQNGAPFEVFLSADQAKPKALEEAGMVHSGSRFTYAVGALALWSTLPDFIEDDYSRLSSGDFNKLALANPKLAPYGLAATEVLDALDLTDATKAKWVQGENIAQTYQFVATGNANLGFVALSQIMSDGHVTEGSSWIVPSDLYSPIRQDAVLLERGADNEAAIALLDYLQSSSVAHDIIHSYGYETE